MSSLIFITEEKQATVVTDTLSTNINGTPFSFTTKAFILPHLNLIISGTGVGKFIADWACQINTSMVVRDIDHLDFHTPKNLRSKYKSFVESLNIADDITSTIYYFGFSNETNKIHSYAYRSIDNFESEKLEYGMGVKPPCELPKFNNTVNDFIEIMNIQRESESKMPEDKRVYIGGEIFIFVLNENGFHVQKIYKFDDYDLDSGKIYSNFNA